MALFNGKEILLAGLKGDPGEKGATGDSVFIRYSDSAEGTNFSEIRDEGMDFIGFAVGQTAPTYKSAYEWFGLVPTGTEGGRAPRTHVLKTFQDLYIVINEHNTITDAYEEAFDADMLRHGDIIHVKEDGVPDFWYAADEGGVLGDKYTYNGTVYNLTVWSLYAMTVMGRVYPIQSGGGAATSELDTLTATVASQDKRILTIEKMMGLEETEFVTIEGTVTDTDNVVTIPDGAFPSAQILEIHGMDSDYDVYNYYRARVKNYPVRVETDTGAVLFEMPSDALLKLSHFGIRGNYIYFEDGKAFYRQTHREVPYIEAADAMQEGEEWVCDIYDDVSIIKLAAPIVTDISDYITSDGVINVGGTEQLVIVPKYTKSDIDAMIDPEQTGGSGTRYGSLSVKIVFEV